MRIDRPETMAASAWGAWDRPGLSEGPEHESYSLSLDVAEVAVESMLRVMIVAATPEDEIA
jgi:hypothetical protein